MPQRTVLNPAEDVLRGRAEVLTVAAEMVRGTGLPDDTSEAVFEWARIRAIRLRDAIDRQVHVEKYDFPARAHPPTEQNGD